MAALTAGALLALAGCALGDADPPTESRGSPTPFHQIALADAALAPAVVKASDALGLDVLAGTDPSSNIVFSPASAVVALGMLAEGATNAGADELAELLGSSGDARSEAINALIGTLAPFEGDPASVDDEELPDSPLLHLANNIVLDDQATPDPSYLARLAKYYDAGVGVTDLSSEEGGQALDAWVREHTGGRIEESAIDPDPDLYLVLQNAVLLAARWQQEFDPNSTAQGEFTSATGQVQTADLMNDLQDLRYAEVDGWSAVELPYQEGFVARFVLPPVGTDPASLDTTMAALDTGLDAAAPSSVAITLPRFDIRSRIDLGAALGALGLTAIFDAGSQSFEGISTDVPLYVGQAVQQATITVGEQGTIAAAVTEIGVMAGSAPLTPEHTFVADRPFLMVVAEAATGWDLFQTVVRTVE